jgi:hypothetical protein
MLTHGNLKDISAHSLKQRGIDPHSLKEEFVGRNFVSKYDIKFEASTKELILVPHKKSGAKIPLIRTGIYFD